MTSLDTALKALLEAVAQGVKILCSPQKYNGLVQELSENNVDALKELPFIADVTKWHLARNLGMDVAKPDVWLVRLAERFGYGRDHVSLMCRDLANRSGERVGVVDYCLWEYARTFGAEPGVAPKSPAHPVQRRGPT